MRYLGTVYLARFGESVKIGSTSNLRSRLRQLEYERGCRGAVLRTIDITDPIRPLHLEHTLRRRFEHLRTDDGWYRLDTEILEWAERRDPV